ncbi:hypothetical protein ACFL5Q_04560 [Planctomycetota bacterium]
MRARLLSNKRGQVITLPKATERWIERVKKENTRLLQTIPQRNVSTLAAFLKSRRILIVEDELESACWDIVLPLLFGADRGNLLVTNGTSLINTVTVSHASTAEQALSSYQEMLAAFDIVLLDLYSSLPRRREDGDHEPVTQITVGKGVAELTNAVKQLSNSATAEASNVATGGRDAHGQGRRQSPHVATSVPQVVAFSVASQGVSARTLLLELGACDFFFKVAGGEPYKAAYFAAFRNCLVGALVSTAARVAGLPGDQDGRGRFHDWLLQFAPAHRPDILRVMKYFKYFSAMGIVDVLDGHCQRNSTFEGTGTGERVSLLGAKPLPPSQLWFSYLGRPNKSGPATLALFSKASWLQARGTRPPTGSSPRLASLDSLDSRGFGKERPQFVSYDDLPRRISGLRALRSSGREICVAFLDDMVLSGGQLVSCLWKFLNRDLRQAILGDPSGSDGAKLWQEFARNLNGDNTELELRVISAVRIHNSALDAILEPPSSDNSPYETVPVRVCMHPEQHEDPEASNRDRRCDCKHQVRVPIGFAEETVNLAEACRLSNTDPKELEGILREYVYIAHHRANELPCQFEPFGWKECQGLVATYANTPGNTLPIIWGDDRGWKPLHVRYFNPSVAGSPTGAMKCLFHGKGCVLGADLDCGKAREVWNTLKNEEKWSHFFDLLKSCCQVEFVEKATINAIRLTEAGDLQSLMAEIWSAGRELRQMHSGPGNEGNPATDNPSREHRTGVIPATYTSPGEGESPRLRFDYEFREQSSAIVILDVELVQGVRAETR